jgi:two-component system cell cycle response regulator DivK
MAETVLVVEDDEANAVLMEAILGRIGGFDVICSDDGDRILEVVAGGTIAAVLMDVSLKNTRLEGRKVDGVDLTRRIRTLPAGAHLPILLLTAHAMRGDRERLLFSSGANDYVAKPIVDQNALVELVRRHISSSGALDGGSTLDTGCNGKA